jgi:bifunctional non-homologous end joining protein LigD
MREVKLSHPDKVLFPEDGITKADLAEHYARVAERMVPQCKDRPMNLWRWNKGISEDVVVQQSLPKGAPDWVARCEVPRRKGGNIVHGMINDADTLRWLAQQNCITPHIWNARCDIRDKPDRIVFDLDPDPSVPWAFVIETARRVRERLRSLGLTSFPKTTGGKGIHVVVPIRRGPGWSEVKAFSAGLASELVREEPDRLTTHLAKARRAGRIFIDTLRNRRGATWVAPYSPRARPGAPVSTPVSWEELTPKLEPDRFTVRSVPERLDRKKDPWAGMDSTRQTVTASMLRSLESRR